MEEPSFIFSTSPIELKQEGENFFVEGYISTSDLDLVNDIVTKTCILDMAEQMKTRTIKLDIEHESFRGKSQIEAEINKTIIPAAKIEDFLIDKKGLKVRAMLNRHIQRFQEVKNSIKDGFLDAFSIAFVPVKETIQNKGGKQVRMLDKINLLNVAFTGNPVNTSATIENVFMKSLDFLGEKAKPKRPKPQPDPHKEPDEEEEDEEKGCGKPKKKEGPGGHKPDKTGPHGSGAGPGQGRADGSGVDEEKECGKKPKKKNIHNHSKDGTIKLQEVKKMTEDKEETTETQEEEAESTEAEPTETKDEETEEPGKEEAEKEEESESTEVKALTEKVDVLTKELAEVKARLKAPVRKSMVEQQDKSENFVDEKIKDPLDLIA